jgi:hypothetical protein
MISPGVFEQFGLGEKEAKVYLAVLELGGASVQAVANRAGIHRVSTYDLLESLKTKGFVFDAQQGKRRIIVPAEPEQVAAALRSKEQLFSALVPELAAIRGKAEGKPRTLYFEGRDGIWLAVKDYLARKKTAAEILVYGSARQLLDEYGAELKGEDGDENSKEAGFKNLQNSINPKDKTASESTGYFGPVRFLPENKKINGNIFIYGDRVLSISWDRLTAVIIEDKYNANDQRCIFNLLWELLP